MGTNNRSSWRKEQLYVKNLTNKSAKKGQMQRAMSDIEGSKKVHSVPFKSPTKLGLESLSEHILQTHCMQNKERRDQTEKTEQLTIWQNWQRHYLFPKTGDSKENNHCWFFFLLSFIFSPSSSEILIHGPTKQRPNFIFSANAKKGNTDYVFCVKFDG